MAESKWNVRDKSWSPTTNEVAVDNGGPECYGKCALLVQRPEKSFTDESFEIVDRPLPQELKQGTALVEVIYLSIDPTQLIWAKEIPQV